MIRWQLMVRRYHLPEFVIKITRSMKKNVRYIMLTLRKRLKVFSTIASVIALTIF